MADLRPVIDLAHKLAKRGMGATAIRKATNLSRYVTDLIVRHDEITARMNAESRRTWHRSIAANRQRRGRQDG